jgi:hypothetical protein
MRQTIRAGVQPQLWNQIVAIAALNAIRIQTLQRQQAYAARPSGSDVFMR